MSRARLATAETPKLGRFGVLGLTMLPCHAIFCHFPSGFGSPATCGSTATGWNGLSTTRRPGRSTGLSQGMSTTRARTSSGAAAGSTTATCRWRHHRLPAMVSTRRVARPRSPVADALLAPAGDRTGTSTAAGGCRQSRIQ